ncbi:S-adenosyl-L-methionine-dependent methyltransferases superfamily protein [Euphorbia peplus]|nr:S-adenosyl-L-methionine-dependent methyltransferases superfamily protein [Euphorbia peplus]
MELITGRLSALSSTKFLNLSTSKGSTEVPKILHMNGGQGHNSYYKNSLLQKKVILETRPILEKSISELCGTKSLDVLKMAEIGCSSGPNALLPLWEIMQTMDSSCSKSNQKLPDLQVFLNDLPGTDFNTIFRSLVPIFLEKLEKEKGTKFRSCFIGAMPGSFHGRLFPQNSLNFVHSSCSLHWLSQVPDELMTESGIPLNKGNICVAETSPQSVQKAYLNQFEKDFTSFLTSRSEEVISGGRMVITVTAKNDSPYCIHGSDFWPLIGMSLNDMAEEGLIQESMLDNWNIPLYYPSLEEVTDLVEKEHSFTIERAEEFELSWDANMEDGNPDLVFDKWERGNHVGRLLRAGAESMIVDQFGEDIVDLLFERLSFKAANYLERGIGVFNHVVISLTKK